MDLITHIDDLPAYAPPGHSGTRNVRLVERDACGRFEMVLGEIAPGGRRRGASSRRRIPGNVRAGRSCRRSVSTMPHRVPADREAWCAFRRARCTRSSPPAMSPLKLLIVYSPPLPQTGGCAAGTGCRSMNRPVAAPHIGDPGALEALYRRFLDDPHDVPRDWARYFAQLGEADPQVAAAPPGETGSDAADALRAASLLGAWRRYGHLAARLDPLASPKRRAIRRWTRPGTACPPMIRAIRRCAKSTAERPASRSIISGIQSAAPGYSSVRRRRPRRTLRRSRTSWRSCRGWRLSRASWRNASPPRSASASRAGTALSLHLKPFLR